jgi:predicted short-subunit dehydrogenase-like oxidoreductase (DUF2520 family)
VTAADGRTSAAAERVAIVGAGRAGRAIAAALVAGDGRDARLALLHGRTAQPSADGLPAASAGRLPRAAGDATVLLVAVRDAQLDDALRALGDDPAVAPDAVVLHASGASDPAALANLRARGHACGTFHPLVPLLGAATADRLRGAWVGVDGDARAVEAARRVARAVGAETLAIPPGAKPAYHAAAVVASNFPVVLAALAARLLRDAGVEPSAADGAVRALLGGAARNVGAAASLAPADAADTLTGPAARGDAATIARHLDALAGDAAAADVYAALTAATVETMRAGGREVLRLDEIERLVRGRRG